MKREVQLYISNNRVDLFKDETISLTDSIKNVRDIAKVFTTFTKSFTLPASKNNNKLFQHYYNFDIINGYDGRIKRDARIEINQAPFKTGKIKLEGVELKSELPHTYRVTFFGNTVDLKDIFKEDKLKDLSFVEEKATGTTATPSAVNKLKDSSGTFNNSTTGVSEGDRVQNVNSGSFAIIESIDSATELTLDRDNIFTTAGHTYKVLLSPFWDEASVKAKLPLQSAFTKNSLITPLITGGRRPVYDDSTAQSDTIVNLKYDAGTNRGLEYTDLKFALRVHEVIKAIENTYTTPDYPTAIDFTTDFFSTSNANYYNLFLWLSRKSGEVSTTTGAGLHQFFVSGFTGGVASPTADAFETGFLAMDTGINLSGTITALQIVITPDGTNSSDFTVTLSRNGSDELTVASSTPTSTVTLNPTAQTGFYRVLISADGEVKITNVVFTVSGSFNYDADDFGTQATETYTSQTASSGAFNNPAISTFDVADQMPDIKVIDFLSGLFKMFNLVAFVNSSGKIEVRTLDNSDTASFYHTNNTTEYDITDYVDIETKQVDVALPYKEITLKYQGLETFLAANHNQLFNEMWGSLNYNEDTNSYRLSGSTYKIELPFAHFKYERFGTTSVQVGWSANKDQNAFLSKPLLFYPLRQASTTAVSFKGSSSPTEETTYNIPSNSRYLSASSGEDNINFGAMINEYAAVSFSGTLFENYYKNYITNIFNTKNRLTKIKAILPLSILLNYELNDIFIIKGFKYRINSITTNLTTGEAKIELLNVL